MLRLEDLKTPAELQAAGRSRIYWLLSQAFAFPDTSFYDFACKGEFLRQLLEDEAHLPYPLPLAEESPLRQSLAEMTIEYDELQSEYIRLFEVGIGSVPCPLYGGMYQGSRKAAMEEVLRFYNYFGLGLSNTWRDLPDHIVAEMEFMHYLTFKEVAALQQGEDEGSYRRAQRDFLERQLARWLPDMRKRLEGLRPPPFLLALASLAEKFVLTDLSYLQQITAA